MNDPFESWLQTNLGTELDRAVGAPAQAAPRYRAQRTSRRLRLVGLTSIPLALSFRLVTALAAAGLAAGGGTAVLIASHTSLPPAASHASGEGSGTTALNVSTSSSSSGPAASNHGAAVTSAVASCKAARPSPQASPKPSPGSRGIGDCVSIVASGGRAHGGAHPTPPLHPTPKPHPTPH